MTVVNASGESATLPGAFLVTPPPPSLSLRFEGKLRDRVGKGNGLTAADGQLDATFKVTVEPGSGPRTVTQLELWTLNGSGRWDTIPTTSQWMVGAASSDSTAPSSTPATAASTSPPATARASTCSPPTSPQACSPPASKSASAPASPTAPAQPPTRPSSHPRRCSAVSPQQGRRGQTLSVDRHRQQLPKRRHRQLWRRHKRHRDHRRLPDKPDGHRRDRRQRDARPAQRHRQQPRRGQRHTHRPASRSPRPAPSLSLRYEGKLRDRVGKGNGLTAADGQLDATFKVTVEPGSGPRTVTQLELWTLNGSGRWDTIPTTSQWMVGAAAATRQPPPQRQQRHRQLRHHRRPELLPVRPRPHPKPVHRRRPSPRPRPPRRRLQRNRRHHPRRTPDAQRRQPAAGDARSDAERDRDRQQLPERRHRQLWRRHKRHRDHRRLPDKPDRHRRDRPPTRHPARATSPSATPTGAAPHSPRGFTISPASAVVVVALRGQAARPGREGQRADRPRRRAGRDLQSHRRGRQRPPHRHPARALDTQRQRPLGHHPDHQPMDGRRRQRDSTAPSTTPATAASTSPPATDRASTCSPPTSPQASSPPASKSASAPASPTAPPQPPTRPFRERAESADRRPVGSEEAGPRVGGTTRRWREGELMRTAKRAASPRS